MNVFSSLVFSKRGKTEIVAKLNSCKIGRESLISCRGVLFLLFVMLLSLGNAISQTKPIAHWWSEAVESSLNQSGPNCHELEKALDHTIVCQHGGLQFLIENMPPKDLQTLSAEFLLDNLTMAYKARQEMPWAKTIPSGIFLNEVLPYASTTEPRENWRKQLYEICMPLIKDCKTPSEVAKVLNEKLFTLRKVKYSTKRRAADQGPLETMQSGIATCTGLSILLVDACRAVGVPARIAGTPLWSNNSGNHTWVEIWDGEWLFTGAAEQDPAGFNRGWFVDNASQAIKDDRKKAIYATSYKKTGLTFPLTWARDVDYVNAVNVTERYASKSKPEVISGLRLMVDVFNRPVGERVAAKVTITDHADTLVKFDGTSKGDTADMNDHLFFQLPKQRTYLVETEQGGLKRRQYFTTGTGDADKLSIFLSSPPTVPILVKSFYTPAIIKEPLSNKADQQLRKELDDYFRAPAEKQAQWKFSTSLDKLLLTNEPAVRKITWESYKTSLSHDSLKSDFDNRKVRFEDHISPYTVKTVGSRPVNGWALFVAMHGGGNTPQEVNDSQWRHMQIYYRDHPEAGGYIYVALRAPDNTWNGFYTGYAYPLIHNLLRQFSVFGDIDPNKKFIMGYSHGGYGAFAIGPKMPDYFAAIHASAAAPADGSGPVTLRNTVFTTMVGEKDTSYGRYALVKKFDKEVNSLRGDRSDIYPVTTQIVAGHPHSGLPDRDKIAEMYANVRNPVPGELTWLLTDSVISDFFWLHVQKPETGKKFDATCKDNHFVVTTDLAAPFILMDSRIIDFRKPVRLELNGKSSTLKIKPSLRTLCETMQRRGDPELAFTAKLPLSTGLLQKP